MTLLFIESLSNETDEQEIKKLFSRHGKVRSVKLTLSAPHSRLPSSGFIEIAGKDVQSIISALDGSLFKGMVLRITRVCIAEKMKELSPGTPEESVQTPIDRPDDSKAPPFRIGSIEKVIEPGLGSTKDWYRYTLINGKSRITGLHRGTLAEVTEYAENSVEAFNLRRRSLRGGKSTTWTSRTKK